MDSTENGSETGAVALNSGGGGRGRSSSSNGSSSSSSSSTGTGNISSSSGSTFSRSSCSSTGAGSSSDGASHINTSGGGGGGAAAAAALSSNHVRSGTPYSPSSRRAMMGPRMHIQTDLNPIAPCGACSEWLKKIAEVNPDFRVLMFEDTSCAKVFVRSIYGVETA